MVGGRSVVWDGMGYSMMIGLSIGISIFCMVETGLIMIDD